MFIPFIDEIQGVLPDDVFDKYIDPWTMTLEIVPGAAGDIQITKITDKDTIIYPNYWKDHRVICDGIDPSKDVCVNDATY